MEKFWIAPSILAADFAHLGTEVCAVVTAGADVIHFDVMDNHYVPNLSFGPMVCAALRQYGIQAPIDVHLMAKPVDALVTAFAQAGASMISFHPEASDHIDRTIQLIKSYNCKVGLAFNPATALNHLDYLIDELDFILLMSVNPGFGGQKFIQSTLMKLCQVRKRIDVSHRSIRLAVDGGITLDNIASIAAAGADMFIAGTTIFSQPNYHDVIRQMRQRLAAVMS